MRKGRFRNADQIRTSNSFSQFKRWRQERATRLKIKDYTFIVPTVPADLTYLDHNQSAPAITWIGHSTFFIQHSGLNIVTDPVWSRKMALHKRLSEPGIPLEQMPPVDVVLISHSHYDHLSITSLRSLKGEKQLLVPVGLKAKLNLKGFFRVQELEWWESATIGGVTFTFVPSQHWSRRTPWDMNRSHWGGWVIEPTSGQAAVQADGPATVHADGQAAAQAHEQASKRPIVGEAPTIYFAGDSGYFDGFKAIGDKFRLDVALMPIGAYEPEWFMGPQHVTPEQSLQAFVDTGARWFVPMHYGAFMLADDTPREALDRLESGRRALGIPQEQVVILPHGETWRLAGR